MTALADETYAKLRREGITFLPLEARESDKAFEQLLSAVRRRARKDGFRVYTWRGTRKTPTPMYGRVFELHHAIDPSKPRHTQPCGIARPDAPQE